MKSIEYDVILGRDWFQKFGYRMIGIPATEPRIEELGVLNSLVEEMEEPEEEEEEEEIRDPRIVEALKKNAEIDPLSSCTHPLAILDFEAPESLSFFIRRNYLKTGEEDKAREQIQEWLEAGVIIKAPLDTKCNFALLMVPKKDGNGMVVGERLCLDLSPINNKLTVDLYPLPNLFECLTKGGKFKGPESYRSLLDFTAAFQRFQCI
jgi:hypothetical protein